MRAPARHPHRRAKARSAAQAAPPVAAAAEGEDLLQKILIVDDELGVREVLTEILREFGFTVTAAENGQRALR